MLNPHLETPRLLVRRFTPEDWPSVFTYASDAEVMAYIPSGPLDETGVKAFIARPETEEGASYALILKAENQLIGHMVFHPWYAPHTFEIGWALGKAHHGQGYASEAALALLKYGFETLNLHRIIATCQPENIASYRVMEKLGMRREGWFQKCIHRGGDTWWSEYFYAILEEEWFKSLSH
jgi:[ribosomal protein S5]-alanine N-acetyltransferase